MKQQDTQAKLGCTMQYNNTIGGQDSEHLQRTTYQHVAPANSLKLTDPQQNQHTSLLKEQNQQGHLLISMDLITDIPLADGHDSILVVVDQGLSKGIILIPCSKTLTSEETA